MTFDQSTYFGHILKGDLRSAISYARQFPEQSDLCNRITVIFENEQYITYDVDADLNKILTIYQQYYRDVFYLALSREDAARNLKDRLAVFLGVTDENIQLCDLEQHQLAALFQNKGFHFMAGLTSGYCGPYIWRTTETVTYEVELPDGFQTYSVKLLDGFITRSWIDYLSFGKLTPGGWADGDGIINCVKSSYDFDSENFLVSLLKHEAQHVRDLSAGTVISSEQLEYRAKLVELIYSRERNLLKDFIQEADSSDKYNAHAMAAYRIVNGFAELLHTDAAQLHALPIEQIQSVARKLFRESGNASE